MKKIKMVWFGLAFVFLLAPLIQSCNDGFLETDYPWIDAEAYSIATIFAVENGEEDEFYFLLDGGQKLYPSDISDLSSTYKWENEQRAIIYFNFLDEKITGYEYNAKIVFISNVLTKNIISLTEQTADSIGDDKINITKAWFGGNYLNIEFQFIGTSNPNKLHMINLVRNETDLAITDDEYLVLEFRHNAYNDPLVERLDGIASFKLSLTDEELDTYKGIKVRSNSIYNGVQFNECLFKDLTTNQITGTQTNTSIQ